MRGARWPYSPTHPPTLAQSHNHHHRRRRDPFAHPGAAGNCSVLLLAERGGDDEVHPAREPARPAHLRPEPRHLLLPDAAQGRVVGGRGPIETRACLACARSTWFHGCVCICACVRVCACACVCVCVCRGRVWCVRAQPPLQHPEASCHPPPATRPSTPHLSASCLPPKDSAIHGLRNCRVEEAGGGRRTTRPRSTSSCGWSSSATRCTRTRRDG